MTGVAIDPGIGRRSFCVSLGAGLTILVIPGSAGATDLKKVPISTGIDAVFVPYVVAADRKIFEKYGLEASYKPFDDGNVALDAVLKQRPAAEWLARLDRHDVPSAPVLRRDEIIDNEQVRARKLIAEFDHPDIGRVRQPVPAARFDRTPAAVPAPAPRIGEHTVAILTELGLDATQVERLRTT